MVKVELLDICISHPVAAETSAVLDVSNIGKDSTEFLPASEGIVTLFPSLGNIEAMRHFPS